MGDDEDDDEEDKNDDDDDDDDGDDETNLDGGADQDEKEVGGGEAGKEGVFCPIFLANFLVKFVFVSPGKEGVGRRLEGALLHHGQDDQEVAQHSKCKDHPGRVRLDSIRIRTEKITMDIWMNPPFLPKKSPCFSLNK